MWAHYTFLHCVLFWDYSEVFEDQKVSAFCWGRDDIQDGRKELYRRSISGSGSRSGRISHHRWTWTATALPLAIYKVTPLMRKSNICNPFLY